jgi:hypothetical protein
MIPVVRIKDGVTFAKMTPGGIKILAALEYAADQIGHDITITSGTDGAHSGPADPHHEGRAFDVRTSDLPDPEMALLHIKSFLAIPASQDWGDFFFAWMEDVGTPNQHFHIQQRRGVEYPPKNA